MPCIYEWIRTWNALEREKNTRKLWTESLIHKVDEALRSYGRDCISVDYNELTGMIDINLCTGRFSDVIIPSAVRYADINRQFLVQELDRLGVGYCLR